MPDHIFDTTVLSNFAVAGRLELLKARYQRTAFSTIGVGNELRKGIKVGYTFLEPALQQIETINPKGWIRLLAPDSAEEYQLLAELDQVLDAGEASCLGLAIARGLTLATDDLAARRLAMARQVSLTGTLGILVASVRDGVLPLKDANGTLHAMIQARYRSPVDRLDDLV